MSSVRLPAWIAFAGFGVGCWGGPALLHGTVKAAPEPCDARAESASASRAPLGSASIEVRCPGAGKPAMSLQADAAGAFRQEIAEPLALGCSVRVSKPGFAARDYAVEDICAVAPSSGGAPTHCQAMSLAALLLPERKTPPPSPEPTPSGEPRPESTAAAPGGGAP